MVLQRVSPLRHSWLQMFLPLPPPTQPPGLSVCWRRVPRDCWLNFLAVTPPYLPPLPCPPAAPPPCPLVTCSFTHRRACCVLHAPVTSPPLPPSRRASVSTGDVFLLTALAKLGATLVTYPMLLIKSRLQVCSGFGQRLAHSVRAFAAT